MSEKNLDQEELEVINEAEELTDADLEEVAGGGCSDGSGCGDGDCSGGGEVEFAL